MNDSTPAPTPLRFASRRDWWLGSLFLACEALVLWALFVEPNQPLSPPITAGIRVVLVGIGLFAAWVWFGTHYILQDDRLLVRSGPFRHDITIDSIIRVEPTRSLLSSAALSRDRLDIRYNRFNFIMISPANRAGFLRELSARSPGLKPAAGGGLRRGARSAD